MSSDGTRYDDSQTRSLSAEEQAHGMADRRGEPGCPTCGAALHWERCDGCGGEGGAYSREDDRAWCRLTSAFWERCARCDGSGGRWRCYEEHEGR